MIELVPTEDGSLSRLDAQTGELYHNRAGAYTEALLNYAEPSQALDRLSERGELKLLDACFGLGYNTFVLLEQMAKAHLKGRVHVCAVENDAQILTALPEVLEDKRFKLIADAFQGKPPCAFGKFEIELGRFQASVEIIDADLRSFASQLADSFDLVFHDAFSPRKVPELWTVDIFSRYYRALLPHAGMLLTYSSASAVRGGLMQAGFRVFKTKAVGAKSGGTLAASSAVFEAIGGIEPLSAEEVKRLKGLAGMPYRDSGFNLTRSQIQSLRAIEQSSP